MIEGALETISSIGGLIGESDDSTVTNSFSSGSVIVSETDSEYVGGLIGESDETIISNSYATGDVKGGEYVGGLIGDSDGDNIITNSFATGNVWGYEDVGGLIGDTEDGDEFYRVYALGTVTAEGGSNFGGLIGRAEETVIEDAYARGWIVGEGYNVGGLIGNSYTVELTNAYATGKIEVDGSNFGGLIGDYEDTVVTAGFWDYELSEEDYTEGDIGEAKTTAEMKVLATFTTELVEYAWDFDQVWAIDVNGENNDGYPYFQWQEFDNEEVDDEDNEDNRNSGSSSGSRVSKQVTVSENIVEDVSQKTYTQEVQEILAKGIVTEKPESETNKCEALVMLSRVFDWEVPIVSTTKYTDVPEWCISVAAFGTERGIVEGRTPTTLGMETPVTRNEVALMLYRELKLQKYEFIGTLVVNFEDVLTPWAAEAITTLAKKGIIKGYSNGTFGGENNILKQDLGVMLLRVAS